MPTIDYRNSKGERVSGVTTIISSNLGWNKQPLMYWAWQQGKDGKAFRETSQAAADAGTIAHYLIECDIRGVPSETATFDKAPLGKAETAYINFLEWKESMQFRVVAVEPHLVSERYQYGLTPDCVAEIKGKLALFDWKSGAGVYEDMLIQLVSYRQGWEENYPDQLLVGGFHLLRIDKETAHFSYFWWDVLPGAWESFLCLLQLHNAHKELKRLSK